MARNEKGGCYTRGTLPDGQPLWVARIKRKFPDGTWDRRSIAMPYDDHGNRVTTHADAIRHRGALLAKWGAGSEWPENSGPTFRDVATRYVDYRQQKRKRPQRFLQAKFRDGGPIFERLGNMPVRSINLDLLEWYERERLTDRDGRCTVSEKKVSPSTVRGDVSVILAALRFAKRRGLLTRVPEPDMLERGKNRTDFFGARPNDLDRLNAAVESSRASYWLAPMAKFALYTGARLGEICSLKWDDVNTDARTAVSRGKTGRKEMYLSGAALDLLAELKARPVRAATGHVFTDEQGTPFDAMPGEPARVEITRRTKVSRRFTEAIRREFKPHEGRDLTFHSLRHAAASHLIRSKASIYMVSKFLGHSSVSMTERYSHVLEQDMLDTADALADNLDGGRGTGVVRGS